MYQSSVVGLSPPRGLNLGNRAIYLKFDSLLKAFVGAALFAVLFTIGDRITQRLTSV